MAAGPRTLAINQQQTLLVNPARLQLSVWYEGTSDRAGSITQVNDQSKHTRRSGSEDSSSDSLDDSESSSSHRSSNSSSKESSNYSRHNSNQVNMWSRLEMDKQPRNNSDNR